MLGELVLEEFFALILKMGMIVLKGIILDGMQRGFYG